MSCRKTRDELPVKNSLASMGVGLIVCGSVNRSITRVRAMGKPSGLLDTTNSLQLLSRKHMQMEE